MPEQPLPNDISMDSLGDNYLLVPYALQFPEESNPLPVGCIIGNINESTLTGYILGANGKWSQVSHTEVSPDSKLFGESYDSIYQSIIGVSGSDWSELHTLKEELSKFVSVTGTIDSPVISVLSKNSTDSQSIQFCSCSSRTVVEDNIFQQENSAIYISVCEECGRLIRIYSPNANDSSNIELNNTTQTESVTFIDDLFIPENIQEISGSNIYLYNSSELKCNKIGLLSVATWWQSNLISESEPDVLPNELNTTIILRDKEVLGVILWSYLLGEFITIEHIVLSSSFDLSSGTIKNIYSTLSQSQDREVYTHIPTRENKLNTNLTPIEFASGSIQISEKPN